MNVDEVHTIIKVLTFKFKLVNSSPNTLSFLMLPASRTKFTGYRYFGPSLIRLLAQIKLQECNMEITLSNKFLNSAAKLKLKTYTTE